MHELYRHGASYQLTGSTIIVRHHPHGRIGLIEARVGSVIELLKRTVKNYFTVRNNSLAIINIARIILYWLQLSEEHALRRFLELYEINYENLTIFNGSKFCSTIIFKNSNLSAQLKLILDANFLRIIGCNLLIITL